MRSSSLLACLAVLSLATIAGCGPTPADRCVEYEGQIQAFLDRCGFVTSSGEPFQVVDTEGMPVCGRVHHLVAWEELPQVCYPFLQNVDCSTISRSDPGSSFPPECHARHFEYTAR